MLRSYLICCHLALALFLVSAGSLAKDNFPVEPRVVVAELGSADDAIGFRYTSQPYEKRPEFKGLLRNLYVALGFRMAVVPGVDLTKESVARINSFVDETGEFALLNIPPERKTVYFLTMNLGDPTLTEALLHAKAKGVGQVHIIVDGQSGMQLKDKRRSTTTDTVTPMENDMGEAIKALLQAGFTINEKDSRYGIFTPKLRARNGIRPLQHMKGLIFLVQGETSNSIFRALNPFKIFHRIARAMPWARGPANVLERQDGEEVRVAAYTLTDNATNRNDVDQTYNRMIEILDRTLMLDQAEHATRMVETFSDSGVIKDIESKPPLRVQYPDGSFIEQAFTDGRFNTNQDAVELLQSAARGERKIEAIYLSQYSLAMESFVEALRSYMDVDKSVRVNGVFDPSFVTGSGLAETLAGFANTSGKEIIRGFSNSAASRIDGWVRRQEVGTSAGRKTWHDKLSVFKVREADGSLWYYIKVGSANLTDHSAENSEIQFFMRLPEHSRLARWFLVSVKGHLQLHPERFAPIDREAIRVNVARFLGVPAGSLTLETLTQIEQQLDANQYGLLGQTLLHAWQDVDANERKISSGEIRRRLRMFHVFLKWYARNVWPQKYYKGDPPMRLPLITDAKDWVLDRILPGRTKLRMQQIGTAFKMIAERDRAGAENLQIQRLIYSMSPDEHFSTEHVQMLVKQLLRDLKIKGNFRALTSQDIEDNLNWNEKPISVSCQVHLGSAQDGT